MAVVMRTLLSTAAIVVFAATACHAGRPVIDQDALVANATVGHSRSLKMLKAFPKMQMASMIGAQVAAAEKAKAYAYKLSPWKLLVPIPKPDHPDCYILSVQSGFPQFSDFNHLSISKQELQEASLEAFSHAAMDANLCDIQEAESKCSDKITTPVSPYFDLICGHSGRCVSCRTTLKCAAKNHGDFTTAREQAEAIAKIETLVDYTIAVATENNGGQSIGTKVDTSQCTKRAPVATQPPQCFSSTVTYPQGGISVGGQCRATDLVHEFTGDGTATWGTNETMVMNFRQQCKDILVQNQHNMYDDLRHAGCNFNEDKSGVMITQIRKDMAGNDVCEFETTLAGVQGGEHGRHLLDNKGCAALFMNYEFRFGAFPPIDGASLLSLKFAVSNAPDPHA